MASNLQERLDNLRQQIQNAAQAGETSDITQLERTARTLLTGRATVQGPVAPR